MTGKNNFVLVDVLLSDRSARGLVEVHGEDSFASIPHPIVVDFQSPQLRHRTRSGTNSEMIVKAVGLKPSERAGKFVFDFTAGLGTDSFLLAVAGYNVIGFERDARVFELLQDGLRRLQLAQSDKMFCLQFLHENAAEYIARESAKPDFIFPTAVIIDPMFEAESTEAKSLPKKEMALLRKMLPASSKEEIRELFHAAVSVASSRVIVKRPIGADEIVEPLDWGRALKPRRLEGKTARFDIYSCRS